MAVSKITTAPTPPALISKVNEIIDNLGGSGATRNIGEIVASTIPLTDAGLHLLDGALLQYGSYQDFIDVIAEKSVSEPSKFTTEALWQAEVTSTGYCNKYVYDSVNNTVRLPKWGNQIVTNLPSTLAVKGNGLTLGLSNGAQNIGLTHSPSYSATMDTSVFNTLVGSSSTNPTSINNISFGVTTDASKSGIVAETSSIISADVYYYVVVATSTKTDIQVDIDEIVTDLNGKADVDGTNMAASVKNFDGQWVASASTLYNNVTLSNSGSPGVYTTSLATYLPNDVYNYEVLFRANTDSASSFNVMIHTDFAGNQAQLYNAAGNGDRAHELILIFGATKTLTLHVYSTVSNFSLYAVAYRRIGTNS